MFPAMLNIGLWIHHQGTCIKARKHTLAALSWDVKKAVLVIGYRSPSDEPPNATQSTCAPPTASCAIMNAGEVNP